MEENSESSTSFLETKYGLVGNGTVNLLDMFLVLEKLDGSMIMPIYVNETELVFRTKRGFKNYVSSAADKFVLEKSGSCKYLEFCANLMERGLTPIFEFYSKENMVVVEYSEPFLTLIAVRSTETGEYMPYDEMCQLCEGYSIPFVKCIFHNQSLTINTLEELKHKVNEISGIEGVVIRHKISGEMFKFKTNWYADLHKKKQLITDGNPSPAHAWKLVLDENVDDVISMLNTEKEKEELRRFNDELLNAIDACGKRAVKLVQDAQSQFSSAKDISNYIADETRDNVIFRKIVYRVKGEMGKSTNPSDIVKSFLAIFIFKELDLVKDCLQTPNLVYNNYKVL